MNAVAPSDALRRQFHGNLEDWEAFLAAYADELEKRTGTERGGGIAGGSAHQL